VKKIFIDTAKLSNLNSGLGQFCLHLGKALTALQSDFDFNFYVPENCKGIFGNTVNYIRQSNLHKFIPIRSKDYKLWHCLHQGAPYLPSDSRTPVMLTIHDLNFLYKYSGLKLKKKLRELQHKINRAQILTAISEFTANEVKQHLDIGNKTIKVIYNGNTLVHYEDVQKPTFVPSGKFLFTLGIIQAKKNFHVLLPLLEQQKSYQLIIAGNDRDDYAAHIKEVAKKYGVLDRLIMPGIITEQEKFWLYSNCDAFLFPSLTEGFGLPVLEAMSLGKPVFLFNGSSLPEIGGSEAYYWNTFDPKEMNAVFMNGMNDFLADGAKKNRMITWAEQFSWSRAAQEYLQLYHSCT
jgi:glycosyltransferase involved in cell wall biosynthesis